MTQDAQNQLKKPACWLARVCRPYRIALVMLLVAIAGAIAWQLLREGQPVYQGRTLFYWLRQHAETSEPPNQNIAAHEAAEVAILHIGTNGLPTLLAWASTRDSRLKKKVSTLMSDEVRGKFGFTANDYHAAASYGFGVPLWLRIFSFLQHVV